MSSWKAWCPYLLVAGLPRPDPSQKSSLRGVAAIGGPWSFPNLFGTDISPKIQPLFLPRHRIHRRFPGFDPAAQDDPESGS